MAVVTPQCHPERSTAESKGPPRMWTCIHKRSLDFARDDGMLSVFICWLVLAMLDHYIWTLPSGLYLSIFLWWIVWHGKRFGLSKFLPH